MLPLPIVLRLLVFDAYVGLLGMKRLDQLLELRAVGLVFSAQRLLYLLARRIKLGTLPSRDAFEILDSDGTVPATVLHSPSVSDS